MVHEITASDVYLTVLNNISNNFVSACVPLSFLSLSRAYSLLPFIGLTEARGSPCTISFTVSLSCGGKTSACFYPLRFLRYTVWLDLAWIRFVMLMLML